MKKHLKSYLLFKNIEKFNKWLLNIINRMHCEDIPDRYSYRFQNKVVIFQ